MSESLVFKQLYPSGRPSYRKSNTYNKMGKSKRNKNDNGSSHSNDSLQYSNNDDGDSTGNNSIDNSIEFNSNGITTASTPFAPKAASFSGYPTEELSKMSNDGLERSWSTNTKNHPNIQKNSKAECAANSSSQSICDFLANFKILIIAILMVIIALIPLFSNIHQKQNVNIKDLKEKFPNQPNETWLHFEAIIDDILLINPPHPAVFLLLYTKENNEVNSLIHHLGKYASAKLETKEEYIYVNKKEFHSEEVVKDYGFLINKYEKDLIKKKVMVVEDLQEIPGKVAQAFHTFCDEITPLVDQVVYIFTLKVDSLNGKEEKIAETYLKRFWNDLDNDILMPLITRVTSTVIKIVN